MKKALIVITFTICLVAFVFFINRDNEDLKTDNNLTLNDKLDLDEEELGNINVSEFLLTNRGIVSLDEDITGARLGFSRRENYPVYKSEDGQSIQYIVREAEGVFTEIIEVRDNSLFLTYREPINVFPANYIGNPSLKKDDFEMNETLLKGELGATWELDSGEKREVVSMDKAIYVKHLGAIDTIEVKVSDDTGVSREFYYRGFGLVRETGSRNIFNSVNEGDLKYDIEVVESNINLISNVEFYYPDLNNGYIIKRTEEVDFNLNVNSFERVVESHYRRYSPLIFPDFIQFNRISYETCEDSNGFFVQLDLNEDIFEFEMGAEYEEMLLNSITLTISNIFNVESVSITINEKPYATDNIKLTSPIRVAEVLSESSIEIYKK